jgi:hypothetical protein
MKVRIKFNDGISEPIHTNKGVRQGCRVSPVLFNIYINKMVQEFKMVIKKGLQLNNRNLVNTILYTEYQNKHYSIDQQDEETLEN